MPTTLTKTSAIKRSVTIRADLDQAISGYENKSSVINEALELFLARKRFLEQAEQEFWKEKIQEGLQDIARGDVVAMNPDGKKMSRDAIAESLGLDTGKARIRAKVHLHAEGKKAKGKLSHSFG